MSELVRVRFIHPHGPYNAGEVAGMSEAVAQKLTGGKRPVAVVVKTDADLKGPPSSIEAALQSLPKEAQDFLSARFERELKDARKGLLEQLEKVRSELKPIQAQAAEKDALIEKQKARIVEMEAALSAAQHKAEGKGKGSK